MAESGEQVRVPPHGAGFQRNLFGFAQARQCLGEDRHDETRRDLAAEGWQTKQRRKSD